MDLLLGLLAIARANETDFGVADEPGWLPANFRDCIV